MSIKVQWVVFLVWLQMGEFLTNLE